MLECGLVYAAVFPFLLISLNVNLYTRLDDCVLHFLIVAETCQLSISYDKRLNAVVFHPFGQSLIKNVYLFAHQLMMLCISVFCYKAFDVKLLGAFVPEMFC